MTMQFQKATKKKAKLRITIDGPTGSGKTYSSLVAAKVLGGKTALIDTEHGSASLYSDLFSFDALELTEHSPEKYIEAINAAGAAGYDVLIIDSLSHAWNGKGGALEIVDRSDNAFNKGWKQVSPMQTRLVDAMLSFPGHLICTMRSKMEYVQTVENGRTVIKKLGMAPIQREGMEYEFTAVVDLDLDGNVHITKTRCPEVHGVSYRRQEISKMVETMAKWLATGVDAAPAPFPFKAQLNAMWAKAKAGGMSVDEWRDFIADVLDRKPASPTDFSAADVAQLGTAVDEWHSEVAAEPPPNVSLPSPGVTT